MKYIRTKNGCLFEVLRESETLKSFIVKPNGRVINKNKVIKQADAIEELCDEFVWREITFDKGKDYKGNDCLIDQDYERDEHEITQEMIKEGIYGAIWTYKGLIYVAKMNDKGDLELL